MPSASVQNQHEDMWETFLQALPDNIKNTITQLPNTTQNKLIASLNARHQPILRLSQLISEQIELIQSSGNRLLGDSDKEVRFFLSILIERIHQKTIEGINLEEGIRNDIVSISAYQRLDRSFWSDFFIKVLAIFENIASKLGWEKLVSFFYQKQVNHNCQHHQDILDKQKKIYAGDRKSALEWFCRMIVLHYDMKNWRGLVQAYLTRPQDLGVNEYKNVTNKTLFGLYICKSEEGEIEICRGDPTNRGKCYFPRQHITCFLLFRLYRVLSNESRSKVLNVLSEIINSQASSWQVNKKINEDERQVMNLLDQDINAYLSQTSQDKKLSELQDLIRECCSMSFDKNPDEGKGVSQSASFECKEKMPKDLNRRVRNRSA